MIKYFCDLCGKETTLISLVRVREVIPLTAVVEDVCFSNKELCSECKENYYQRASVALVKVWEDLSRDTKMVE